MLVLRVSTDAQGFDNFLHLRLNLGLCINIILEAYTENLNLSCRRVSRHEQKPRYGRLKFLKNFRVRKKFHIFGFLQLKMTSYLKSNSNMIRSNMILPDRSNIFPIPLGGCESFFVEKSRRYGEKSKFSEKNF